MTPRCDHCRLRRKRVETFVVWHAGTQRLRQVGTGCLRDFLGGHDPERLCRQAEYVLLARQSLAAATSEPGARHTADDGVALEVFAAHAAMALRAHGWISRERARETGQLASADAALHSLRSSPLAPRSGDVALATAALAWARELLPTRAGLSEFERDATARPERRPPAHGARARAGVRANRRLPAAALGLAAPRAGG